MNVRKIFVGMVTSALVLSLAACTILSRPQAAEIENVASQETAGSEQTSAQQEALLQDFLRGEVTAVPGENSLNDLVLVSMEDSFLSPASAVPFSLSDLTCRIAASPDLRAAQLTVSYAIPETPSGVKILVVRYAGFDRDPSAVYFVFTAVNAQVELIYSCDSWSRRSIIVKDGAVFVGCGSSGAGDSSRWIGTIDHTGTFYASCSVRTLTGDWVAMYLDELTGIVGNDTSWARGSTLEVFTDDGGRTLYYTLQGDELSESQLAFVRQTLQDFGIQEAAPSVQGMWDTVLTSRSANADAAEITNWTYLE